MAKTQLCRAFETAFRKTLTQRRSDTLIEKSILDFEPLGFVKNRIANLKQLVVVRMVQNYERWYLAELVIDKHRHALRSAEINQVKFKIL